MSKINFMGYLIAQQIHKVENNCFKTELKLTYTFANCNGLLNQTTIGHCNQGIISTALFVILCVEEMSECFRSTSVKDAVARWPFVAGEFER